MVTDSTQNSSATFEQCFKEISKIVVGQHDLILRILVVLLAKGHVLIEGVPGIAKTLAAKTVSKVIGVEFKRIQFTPDLLPSDLLGTSLYDVKEGGFRVEKGPLFSNIVLADEINRAPPKVQSALLEVMAEQQITLFGTTFKLESPFFVLATQNPIEQEGTYTLPEAQCDRFMMKILSTYPTQGEEEEIIQRLFSAKDESDPVVLLSREGIIELQKKVHGVFVDRKIMDYIVKLVTSTRPENNFGSIPKWVEYGASPRASIAFLRASQAYAFIQGRTFVTPADVKFFAKDIIRHRLVLKYEAEAEGVTPDAIVDLLLSSIEVGA